jgi:hypothetical protein
MAMSWSPESSANAIEAARDLAAPSDPNIVEIFQYWDKKRGARRMPRRTEIDLAELRGLVHNLMLLDVVEPGRLYRVRLVGGAIVDFAGLNITGEWAETRMPPDAAAQMIAILTSVVITRAPRFRAGRAYWHAGKSYRRYEACFLPLSPDDDRVDKIMTGIAFDKMR